MIINNPTLAHLRHFSQFRHSAIILYSRLHPFMQNKPNFPHLSPKNGDFTKNKANFKPNFNYPERSKKRSSFLNVIDQISFSCLFVLNSVFCIMYSVLFILFIKSMGLLSASQRFAMDKLIRKRRSMIIKKLTVSRLVANLMQRRVIWRFSCFLIRGIETCFWEK